MATNYKKIMISIPIELDKLVNTLVKESKNTSQPLTKSGFISSCIYDTLERSINILERQNAKGGK